MNELRGFIRNVIRSRILLLQLLDFSAKKALVPKIFSSKYCFQGPCAKNIPSISRLGFSPELAALLLFCAVSPLAGHPDTQVQIARISEALKESRASAELFLSRAYLYMEHESLDLALADYRAFRKLDERSPAGSLGEARVLIILKRFTEAKAVLDRHLEQFPRDASALLLVADIASAEQRQADEIEACQKAIRARQSPHLPDWIRLISLESSISELPKGRTARATLKRAQTLFPSSSQLLSLELELAERFEDWMGAVAVLDRQMEAQRRKEIALFRKAAFLEKAGRIGEAATGYRKCLQTIDSLPEFLRLQEHVQKLAADCQSALLHLDASDSAATRRAEQGDTAAPPPEKPAGAG